MSRRASERESQQRRHVNALDKDSAVDQGTYVFGLTGGDGTVSEVSARYTFVYEKHGSGDWKVVSHHSSKFPAG